MRSDRPEWQQRIASERISILFDLARRQLSKNPDRSRRYVGLARKIGMRYKVRLDGRTKSGFCKKCSTLLVPGRTSTVRLDSGKGAVSVKCMNCDYSFRKTYK